ncbi:uncharacterized protein LOC132742097 isoform X10 [Ruditapes philippinarum]|uniref:uncharacterized protein LOC132742097 isoform X10 n=1 Tax=Ruditapes philippinarum TaxID=129788 RepID=UPI00295BFDB3|nr:uncharacterized protein LOC132742097 isoform X10 [Ruditapes philippinarum]
MFLKVNTKPNSTVTMEVTPYEVIPECYPRFKNADKRICDITDRTNKLLLDTFVPTLVRKTFPKRNICHNVKLYLCKMEEDKMNLNVENFVMKNESYTTKQTHKYRNAGQFLTENRNSFDSTTVLVFQACQDLGHELEKFLQPGPSVIIVTCLKEGQDAENQYDHLNCKTVPSEENIAEVIGSLLEQMAFKPMKEMFEYIRGLCYENHSSSIVTKLDRSEPEQMLDTNGSLCNEGKLAKLLSSTNDSHNKKRKLETSTEKGTCTTPRQEVNGFARQCNEIEENEVAKQEAKLLGSTNDSHNKKRKLETSTEKGTCTTPRQEVNGFARQCNEIEENEVAKQEAKLLGSTNDSHNKKRKLETSTEKGTCTTPRQEVNGFERQCNEIEENEMAKQEVSKPSSPTNDSHNEERKLQTCTETGTCASSSDDSRKLNGLVRECNEIEENEIAKQEVSKISSSMNDPHNGKRRLQTSSETGTCTSSSDGSRKLNGLVRVCNEIEENEIAKREVSKPSSSTNDSHNEERKLQTCTETGTCASSSDDSRKLNECFNSDEKSNRKFRESKEDFQRLLGEMIGMYRRSRLPETLKPHLDGPWGKESDQVIRSLYRLSPSVRGYSYKFITRLQIHVFGNDIEKLRPKIAEILNNHGIKSDSYDVVPPLDDVKQFSKILSGSRVEVDESKHFGSLTSFVKMTPKTQKTKTYCSLASKHLLQGQKTLDILSKERTLKADVIEKTAPLGDLNMLFDIAAARIKKEDELHCDGRFKTENGTLMKGKMNKDDSIDCLHVHMYGAETPFSRGIIATTQYINIHSSVNGEESQPEAVEDDINEVNRFIYVQSRDKTKPFCKQGDSGAMVCADHEEDNHVELISSVIGGPLIVKNKDGKNMITDSYQTLRLRSGVDYLEKLTQSDIEFFDS